MYNIKIERKIGDYIKLRNVPEEILYEDIDGNDIAEELKDKINLDSIYEVVAVNASLFINESGHEEINIFVEAVDILRPLEEYYVISQSDTVIATDEEIFEYEDSLFESHKESFVKPPIFFFEEEQEEKESSLVETIHKSIDSALDEYKDLMLLEKRFGEDERYTLRKKELEKQMIDFHNAI